VDAEELWVHLRGAPLLLETSGGVGRAEVTLGGDPPGSTILQHAVPAGRWQRARTTGDWSLVSCVVVPEFRFEGFELAPQGWEPTG
jgi:uncharacterized protein